MKDNSVESAQTGHEETEKQKQLKILIVEDDQFLGPLMPLILRDYKTTMFASAEKALDALRQSKESNSFFDWVITDRELAGKMDGFDLARQIKDEELGKPYVTMLTGSARIIGRENSPQQLKQKGIDKLIDKPFAPKELLDLANVVREFREHPDIPQKS